jgi:hypothetical protein
MKIEINNTPADVISTSFDDVLYEKVVAKDPEPILRIEVFSHSPLFTYRIEMKCEESYSREKHGPLIYKELRDKPYFSYLQPARLFTDELAYEFVHEIRHQNGFSTVDIWLINLLQPGKYPKTFSQLFEWKYQEELRLLFVDCYSILRFTKSELLEEIPDAGGILEICRPMPNKDGIQILGYLTDELYLVRKGYVFHLCADEKKLHIPMFEFFHRGREAFSDGPNICPNHIGLSVENDPVLDFRYTFLGRLNQWLDSQ